LKIILMKLSVYKIIKNYFILVLLFGLFGCISLKKSLNDTNNKNFKFEVNSLKGFINIKNDTCQNLKIKIFSNQGIKLASLKLENNKLIVESIIDENNNFKSFIKLFENDIIIISNLLFFGKENDKFDLNEKVIDINKTKMNILKTKNKLGNISIEECEIIYNSNKIKIKRVKN